MGYLKNLAPLALLTCLFGGLATSAQAQIQLITNGNFETGALAPWVVTDVVFGSYYVISNGTPPGGNACCTTVGPASGNNAASSGSSGTGQHALVQSFTVPLGTARVVLSFDQFVNDYFGVVIDPGGLDWFLSGGANYHARVDLLTATAMPFDTTTGVIRNFYIGDDGLTTNGHPNPYIHYSFDITANVKPGGTYQLRFAEVNGAVPLNQGIDNVSVLATPGLLVSYAANLAVGDSFIDISNSGASGAGLQSGTTASITGSICANVYAFTPDEQMVSCCSCPVTPNGLVSLSAKSDLASNTLTPAIPSALVIKLLATAPVSGSCNNSAAAVQMATLASGMFAFSTTIHATPVAGSYGVTERPFSVATLSTGGTGNNIGELARLGQLCNFIIANGSGFGVCRSCRLGGLSSVRE